MSLTKKQKNYIKKNIKRFSLAKIAADLNVSKKEVLEFLKSRWRKKKYQKFLKQYQNHPESKKRIADFNLKKYLIKNWKVFAFLTFLVLAVYSNSLKNNFLADDIPGIVNNPNLNNFSHIISHPLKFIRPLLYFLAYKVGGLNPLPYRLINIAFHLGSVWIVYILIDLIADWFLALAAAAIFAVHPILIESVTWISGGVHAQYSFFLLLAFLSYILFLSQEKRKFLLIANLSFIFSLISSEKAVILPIILLVFVFAFKKISRTWKSLLPFFIISLLFGFVYLKGIGPRTAALQTKFYQQKTGIQNPFIQIPIAITSYLKLIFGPKDLTLYHSEMKFSQTKYLLSAAVFVLFLSMIAYFLKKDRRISFWLSFFLISLLPTLTPLGISWIVAERYVYLGSLGIFVLIAIIIKKIGAIFKNQKVSYLLLAIILIVLSVRTIIRNKDWKNQDTLWLAAAKTSPSSPQNHNNLGDYYGRHGSFKKAAEEFKKAIALKPNYGDAYHNLANTYHQMGKDYLAIKNYQKALSFNPNLWQSYQNLAAIYFNQNKFGLAEKSLKEAIKINPKNANLHLNLGIVYLKLSKKKEAESSFQKALQLDPQNQKAKQLLLTLP